MSEQDPTTPEPSGADSRPADPQSGGESFDALVEAAPTATGGAGQPEAIQPGELSRPPNDGEQPLDLDYILDIPLHVSVEVGRTRLMIEELLKLGKGSVIELNKLLGEPFEMLVNDKLVARGEVVVVNDRFGLRLTDIISPNERVQTLA